MQELVVFSPPRTPTALVVGAGAAAIAALTIMPWALSLFVWGACVGSAGLLFLALSVIIARRLPAVAAASEAAGLAAVAGAAAIVGLLFL